MAKVPLDSWRYKLRVAVINMLRSPTQAMVVSLRSVGDNPAY